MFIISARNFHTRRIWYRKPAPENEVDLWRRFLEHVRVVDTRPNNIARTCDNRPWLYIYI